MSQPSAFLSRPTPIANNLEKNHISIDQKDAPNTSLDLLYIFATSLYKTNTTNSHDFISITHLDIEEPEIYK